jgi:hypothetical protein
MPHSRGREAAPGRWCFGNDAGARQLDLHQPKIPFAHGARVTPALALDHASNQIFGNVVRRGMTGDQRSRLPSGVMSRCFCASAGDAAAAAKATRIVVRLNFRIVGLSWLGDDRRLWGELRQLCNRYEAPVERFDHEFPQMFAICRMRSRWRHRWYRLQKSFVLRSGGRIR